MVAISALLLVVGAVAGQTLLVRAQAQTGAYRECADYGGYPTMLLCR